MFTVAARWGLVALAVMGCSSSGSGDSTPATNDAAQPISCDAPEKAPSTEAVTVKSLGATLVDQSGATAGDAPVTVCDSDTCLGAKVGSDGAVTLAIDPLAMRGPAMKIGNGLEFALLAFPLLKGPDFLLGRTTAVRLPDDGAALSAGSESTSSGVTLSLAAGATIVFDELTYPKRMQTFRVAKVPLDGDKKPLAIDPSVEMAWAMAPQGTTFCPRATLTLPNDRGWSAGTEVEILAHGVELHGAYAAYGEWSVVSTARVSDDGATIRTAPGEGLPLVTAIGLRRK